MTRQELGRQTAHFKDGWHHGECSPSTPDILKSDNGGPFNSGQFHSYAENMCFRPRKVTPYRAGSREGGLGGAPQLTWMHTRSTYPFLTRMHARARIHTHSPFWSTRMPIPNLHFGQFNNNKCYPNSTIRNVHWFHSGHNQCAAFYAFAKKEASIQLADQWWTNS